MMHARILGYAVIVLVAVMAMAGTASATYLTSPSGTTYTGTVKLENEGTVTLTSAFGGFGSISCKNSVLSGTVETHGASVTAGWNWKEWSFHQCVGGEETTVANAGFVRFHGTGTTGNATVTIGSLSMVFHQTFWGTCIFTAPITGSHLGLLTGSNVTGSNASLHVNATLSSDCGAGSLVGTYKVVNPSYLAVH